jgi:hypothetical protein
VTTYQDLVIRMLFSTALRAQHKLPYPYPSPNPCEGSDALLAAYHRHRRAIEASPESLADWIALRATNEFAAIIRQAHEPQLELFDFPKPPGRPYRQRHAIMRGIPAPMEPAA